MTQELTPSQTHIFHIGRFQCISIQDEDGLQTAANFFTNVPEDERHLIPFADDDEIALSYNCLLVNIGTQRVLIDAGNGVETGGDGRLLAHLEVLGIGRNEIDIVVLTHAHLDHYAGMLHQSGAKIFPNARYLMWHDEWEYYSSTEQLERERARSEERLAFIEQWFLPLGPYLELIDADLAEIAPGIRANYLPGHTRHHIGFIVESEGEQLLVSGDTFLHPLFLKQPHWHLPFDLDPVVLKQTREQLIALSAENDMLVHSYHTAFPGLGRISIEDSLVRWEAV